jgi:hypothetical protein
MQLNQYINQYFDGNKAAFGRAFNRLPQNVTKLFNNPSQWLVIIEDKQHTLVQIRASRVV